MARARNIKPSFFENEYLAELSPHCRLLFIGLWTLADREGRLEDRPKKIRAAIFPYEDVDADVLLSELSGSRGDFILRYSVAGVRYIQISNFTKHQNPHIKEAPSTLPQPSGDDVPTQDLHHACTVQEPDQHHTSPADSLLLIPDSPLLIPSIGANAPRDLPATSRSEDAPPERQREEPRQVFDLYNAICVSLPRAREMSAGRTKKLRERIRAHPDIEWWRRLFQRVQTTPFCCGAGERGWRADLDWLIANDTNALRVLEGKYDTQIAQLPSAVGGMRRMGDED